MADHDAPPSLVDVALFAPLGLAVVACDELPKALRQRRQAVENRIQLARWIGQLAVQQVRREMTKRLESAREEAAARAHEATPAPAPGPGVAELPAEAEVEIEVAVPDSPASDDVVTNDDAVTDDDAEVLPVPTVDELPIAGYESLAALHVVQRLASLHADELDSVRRFEQAHRGRRTILAKIEQLQAG